MAKYSPDLSAVFAALADPTRRRMIERLARGEMSAGELAAGFPISLPAVSKHLKVLEHSGLLKRTVVGRVHRLRLVPKPMSGAAEWIESQRRYWNAAFDRLDQFLTQDQRGKKTTR